MPFTQHANGTWELVFEAGEQEQWNPAYAEALPRYLNALDRVFIAARQRSEFEFLTSLFRFRGLQAAGWDPFETTLRAIPGLVAVQQNIENFETARHLHLWLYVHILEASEPYEILANLVDVSTGGRFLIDRFPPAVRPGGGVGPPRGPGYKIRHIIQAATGANLGEVEIPLNEILNRDFRNAISHADYTLHGGDVRTTKPIRTYSHDDVMTLVNRALAYHEAFVFLFRHHVRSYTAPVTIPVHPGFSANPDERAVVIVREGDGAIGLKDGWTPAQIAAGAIPWRFARLYADEVALLNADPTLALLPPRPTPAA